MGVRAHSMCVNLAHLEPHEPLFLMRTCRTSPARSREMLVNSVARNFCRLLALVVAVRRLTSSRSTDAGWCFTACMVYFIMYWTRQ